MLRMDSNLLRVILLTISAVGILLFISPMAVHIVNIGNLFGLACSVLLLGFTVFNQQFSRLLDTINNKKAGAVTLRILAGGIVLGMLYCLILSCFMIYHAKKEPKDTPQAVIVLGCKVRGTVPSLMLSRRIKAAYEVLQANPELPVVVSGGKGSDEEISEAQCMYNELTRMGIVAERIYMEDRSTTTSENMRFSKEILDANGLTGPVYLATDGYHEMRAQILAKNEQLPPCYPAAAYTSWYLLPTYWIREWFGIAHAFVFGN